MSSLFRSRRPEADPPSAGSGGKIVRLRRRRSSASPYAVRPLQQAASPWSLGGLISGAGKLISSVLPYQSSQTASSSSDDDDEEEAFSSDEGVHDLPSKEHQELHGSAGITSSVIEDYFVHDQRGKDAQFNKNRKDGSPAITPKSKSKHVLVQLLMRETFSRDECDELTKLIQSRVVDFPSSEACGDGAGELPSQTNCQGITSVGASGPLKKIQKFLEGSPYSSGKLNVFSPAPSAYKEQTLDLCSRAVMEAKKWFDEKKLSANSKYDSECGRCTLNTNVLDYDIGSEQGSPVDMAKSYMQSLPPWRSPLLSSKGFKTPPSNGTQHIADSCMQLLPPWRSPLSGSTGFKTPTADGTHHCYKRTSYAMTKDSLLSSKVLKRDRIAIGSWDTLDETRQVRQKATKELDISNSKQIESSAGVPEHNSPNLSSEPAKRGLYVGDNCSNGTLRVPDEKAELKNPLESSNVNSSLDPAETINAEYSPNGSSLPSHCPHPEDTVTPRNTISDPEETINAEQLTHGSAIPSIHPPEPTHGLGENQSTKAKENGPFNMLKDAKESHTMEQIESMSVPYESHLSASTSIKHYEISSSEVKAEKKIQSAEPGDAVDATNMNVVHTSNLQTVTDSSCQLNLVAGVEGINTIPGLRPQEGISPIPNVADGSISESSGNIPISEVNTSTDHESLSKEPNVVVENGTRMKSIERILTEPKPSRRRKVVVTKRKSKGKS
ncbi:protein KAKU4 isoform X2 [Iris pallida]|uniref:Protein KAKU4 isoform X2 n=1 Tax=Iris pallida TaxID=29817 RepID=A0AAX6ILB5_IRIPA|nr:protein KAKU4 isoform X2 [Iris pallida]